MKSAQSLDHHHLGLAHNLEGLGCDQNTEDYDDSQQNQTDHLNPLKTMGILTGKAPLWGERSLPNRRESSTIFSALRPRLAAPPPAREVLAAPTPVQCSQGA